MDYRIFPVNPLIIFLLHFIFIFNLTSQSCTSVFYQCVTRLPHCSQSTHTNAPALRSAFFFPWSIISLHQLDSLHGTAQLAGERSHRYTANLHPYVFFFSVEIRVLSVFWVAHVFLSGSLKWCCVFRAAVTQCHPSQSVPCGAASFPLRGYSLLSDASFSFLYLGQRCPGHDDNMRWLHYVAAIMMFLNWSWVFLSSTQLCCAFRSACRPPLWLLGV